MLGLAAEWSKCRRLGGVYPVVQHKGCAGVVSHVDDRLRWIFVICDRTPACAQPSVVCGSSGPPLSPVAIGLEMLKPTSNNVDGHYPGQPPSTLLR